MFFKIGVPIYFTNFTRKHLCWREHLICNFIKKRVKYTCLPVKFPVKFKKFLRAPFFYFYRTPPVAAPVLSVTPLSPTPPPENVYKKLQIF